MQGERSDAAAWAQHHRLFAALLALSALFRVELAWVLGSEGLTPPRVTTMAVVALALAVCWRPERLAPLLALAAAQVADVLVSLPEVANHRLIGGFASLALLVFAARAARRDPALLRDGGGLLKEAAPSLRAGTALFYAFACLWKLNQDFLRPEHSCAAVGWTALAELYGLPASASVARVIIGGTLLVEGAGAVLLLVRATRAWTAAALAGFHLLLGLDAVHNYQNFSSVMFPLLWLFLDPRGLARIGAVPAWAPRVARGWTLLWALAAGLILAAPALETAQLHHGVIRQCAFVVHALLVLALFVLAAASRPPAEPRRSTGLAAAAWLFPCLVLVNGLGPALGFRNRASWQMYSNLRLEADASNHLLLPRSLDLLGLLRDRVDVLATSDPAVAKAHVGTGLALPWISFHREMAARPETFVSYRRGGRQRVVDRVGGDPELATPPPWPARALFFFRPLGPQIARECAW